MATPPFVTSIQDINDQYDYTDKNPGGAGDKMWVSCGQDGSYNELQEIYDTHMKAKVNIGFFTEQEALNALNSACFNIKGNRARKEFYKYINDYLGHTVFPANLT